MDKIDVEAVPALVRSGALAEREGVRIVWADVYTNTARYGLSRMTEDARSELLLDFSSHIAHLIAGFDPRRGSFRTFLRGCLENFRASWRRKELRARSAERALAIEAEHDAGDGVQYEIPEFNGLMACSDSGVRPGGQKSRLRKEAETTALILALKACRDVDDGTLAKVSRFTGMEAGTLQEKVERLRQKQADGNGRAMHDMMVVRRNRAYFFHRAYSLDIISMEENGESSEQVRRKYEAATARWRRQNDILSHRFRMVPSNGDVAKELGIKPRKVYFCISRAKKRDVLEAYQNLYHQDEDGDGQ